MQYEISSGQRAISFYNCLQKMQKEYGVQFMQEGDVISLPLSGTMTMDGSFQLNLKEEFAISKNNEALIIDLIHIHLQIIHRSIL
jgi:predicted PP-loop superfamily ATPase